MPFKYHFVIDGWKIGSEYNNAFEYSLSEFFFGIPARARMTKRGAEWGVFINDRWYWQLMPAAAASWYRTWLRGEPTHRIVTHITGDWEANEGIRRFIF